MTQDPQTRAFFVFFVLVHLSSHNQSSVISNWEENWAVPMTTEQTQSVGDQEMCLKAPEKNSKSILKCRFRPSKDCFKSQELTLSGSVQQW